MGTHFLLLCHKIITAWLAQSHTQCSCIANMIITPVSIKAELTYGGDISDGTKLQLQPKKLALFPWLTEGHYMYQ